MAESIAVDAVSKRFELGALRHENMLRERLMRMLRGSFLRESQQREIIWALRGVSFRIQEGEVVGIIGRNGAGKSTLLKILSKITYPTSGRIRTNGRLAALLEVGTGFHEELTGRENIYLNASILGMKKTEVRSKLDQIVGFAGVERFIDTPIKRYSSGMRLRLGFAVAAHLDPDILIVDEVLAVGDAAFQKKCIKAMGDLRSGGRTVLFVSHNMAAVENLCTRCIWIDDGQVREDGAVHSTILSYMATSASPDQAATDLSGVTTRRGTGDIHYTKIEFLSPDGAHQPVTRSGDSIVVRLRYHATKPIGYPSFGFRILSELGTLVTETSTWHHRLDFPEVTAGDGYIDLEIGALNLMPGRYYFSVGLTGQGNVMHDFIEQCACLDVETANIYNAGRTLDSRFGIVHFPQRWRLHGVRTERVLSHTADDPDVVPRLG